MAKSSKSATKHPTIAQFPQPSSPADTAVEDIPEAFQEPEAQITPQENGHRPAAPSRNPLKKKEPRLPADGDFFQKVAAIPAKDWDSQRVYLYLYVLEPLCNLKQSGGKSYLNRYSQPVRDEHQIAVEYGSGRYRMMLAYNKVSPDESTEIARVEFEIYNPQYPPKVPKAAWINDARNAKWEALLPKDQPAAPAGAANTMLDAMKMYGEIRREVKEEIPVTEPVNRTSEVLETMRAARELFAPQQTNTNADQQTPLQLASALFSLMNQAQAQQAQAKADNPVIDLYKEQLKMMSEELREIRRQQQPAPAKGLADQLLEFAALGDKLDPIKKLFGLNGSNGGGEAVRVGRTTGMDLARELGSKIIDSPIAEGLGQWLGSLATRNVSGPAPAMNPAGPPNQVQQQPSGADFQNFIRDVINPALQRHYLQGLTGADFAAWLDEGFPDRLKQLQNFTHPMLPGQRGASAIISAYKHTDSMWPILSSRGEEEFTRFVEEFCQWTPEDEQPLDVEHQVIDDPEGEEGPERI